MIYLLGFIPILFAVLAYKKGYLLYKVSVTLSCILICVISYMENKGNVSIFFIIIAFVFSIIGDIFLSNRKVNNYFYLYGIISFFLAHLFYLSFMLSHGKINVIMLLTLLFIYSIYFTYKIFPALKDIKMIFAIIFYILISCLTLSSSIGLNTNGITKLLTVSGISLILISDTIIAEKDFIGKKKYSKLILPTYYMSHILITYAVIFLYKYNS